MDLERNEEGRVEESRELRRGGKKKKRRWGGGRNGGDDNERREGRNRSKRDRGS